MTPQTLFTNWPSYYSWGNQGQSRLIAYFSMEIAITPAIPTYSGGLGVLAGDTLRAAADMRLPLVAVTLAHRKGYVKQHLDANGVQSEEDQPWDLEGALTPEDPVVTVLIEGRTVAIRVWRYDIEGVTGHRIPVYLLDTELEENDPLPSVTRLRLPTQVGHDAPGCLIPKAVTRRPGFAGRCCVLKTYGTEAYSG